MPFHPLTHIAIAVEFCALAVTVPLEEGLVIILFGLVVTTAVPQRTDTHLLRPFLGILGLAALFLFLMHGVRFNPPEITHTGVLAGLPSFIRIAAPVIAMLHLSRYIRSEELFALLLDLRVPPAAILILFRTIWLIPRLAERMEETVTALRLRGMPTDTLPGRIRALVPSLGTVFSSMFAEISDNSLVLAARGFLRQDHKSHLIELRFRSADAAAIAVSTLILAAAWC
jgi:energy-coupling factor transporter transmembrane protein EcfT